MRYTIFLFIIALLMVVVGSITAVSPLLGGGIYLALVGTIFFYLKPTEAFFGTCLLSFLSNVNLIYESPNRIVSERYALAVFPILLLFCIVVVRKIAGIGNSGESKTRIDGTDLLVLIFFLWTTITILWSIDIYHGVNVVFSLFLGCILYYMAIHFIRDKETLENFMKVLCVGGVFLCFMVFISNKIDGLSFSNELSKSFSLEFTCIIYGRRPGGFAPPQLAGNILVFIFFLGCAIYPKAKPAVKFIMFLLSFFFCSTIFATGSKAAAGSYVLSVLSLIIFYPGLRKKFFIWIPAAMSFFTSVFFFNLLFLGYDRLASESNISTLSLSSRLGFWETGFDMLSDRIIGAGVGGFARLVDPWPGAHSFYLGILFDVGFVGLIMFFIYMILISAKSIKVLKDGGDEELAYYLSCLLAFNVAFFIHGTVDIAYYLSYVWLFWGVLAAVIKIAQKSRLPVPSQAAMALS